MNKRIESLQALRGLAAILVMLFHYRFYLRSQVENGTTIWDALFGWGIIGVDIFFIISGFIMVYTTQNYTQSLFSTKRFLINRAIRIFPMYYVGLLITFLLSGAMSTFHYPEKVQNLLSALTFTVYKTDITPHYIDDGGMYNIRWTLNYEVYFYIAFSVCLLVKHRLLALIGFSALMICLIPAIAGFQPTTSIQGYPFHSPTLGLLTNPVFLEFIIGAIVGYLYLKLKNITSSTKIQAIASFISLSLFMYVIYGIYNESLRAFNTESAIILGVFILFITLADPLLKKYIPHILTYLGDISFSLYLLHGAIGSAVMKRMELFELSNYKGIVTVVIAISLSIFISHLTHKYIEIRLTRKLKKRMLPVSSLRQKPYNLAN
ncbi:MULTISPECIES: acyltransferase family protein [Citrobacter]|uniref:acyltransferase family protein n=1 Tax=Citrobacter TaxID=544 RepID=UPI000C1EEE43|nr:MULTISPECIES: acyltransferase [Citrobacter]ATX02857.1 acyltransferase [Citrobacter freundii]MBJ8869300.1 acyltransferase [Citrobacter braakii]MBJ8900561.1 acyltransferase [Citrobacter braakii]MBJ8905216.1 acyltransferase [Citrobacter braakii]MBJ8920376.1 acyltransferase [Citrobacter braakii]